MLKDRTTPTVLAMAAALACSTARAGAAATAPLVVDPATVVVCSGASQTFSATRDKKPVKVAWSLDPARVGKISDTRDTITQYTAPEADRASTGQEIVARTGTVALVATDSAGPGGKPETVRATITLVGQCGLRGGGEIVLATLGYEQVGAAGTDSSQKFSFDFFISRPLPIGSHAPAPSTEAKAAAAARPAKPDEGIQTADYFFGPPVRWWGQVRIGSYPQQVNSEVAKFDVVSTAGKLTVNRLAQSAEFLTGPEVRLAQFPEPRGSTTETARQRFALTAFAGFGAIGPFNPSDTATVFQVPSDTASPQYAAFKTAYPAVIASGAKYVAFVPRSSSRFLHQWTAGLRLYTFYAENTSAAAPLSVAPALVEASAGSDELVAQGAVWRASAYYPFAFGDRSNPQTLVVYLFGDVVMGGTRTTTEPLFLAAATDKNGAAVPLTDPNVFVVSTPPNSRDTYRFGVSLDLLRVWRKLTEPSGGSAKTQQ